MTTLASTVVNSTWSPYTMPSWIRSRPMSMRREGSSSETASFCWKRVAHGSSPMWNTWFGCARCGLVGRHQPVVDIPGEPVTPDGRARLPHVPFPNDLAAEGDLGDHVQPRDRDEQRAVGGRAHVVDVVERRQRDAGRQLERGHPVDEHLGLGRQVQEAIGERARLEQDGRVLRRALRRGGLVLHELARRRRWPCRCAAAHRTRTRTSRRNGRAPAGASVAGRRRRTAS